jgi:hypothetical protein
MRKYVAVVKDEDGAYAVYHYDSRTKARERLRALAEKGGMDAENSFTAKTDGFLVKTLDFIETDPPDQPMGQA